MRECGEKSIVPVLGEAKERIKEWGDITIMSILDLISFESKSEVSHHQSKVHQDLFQELKNNVEQIAENIVISRHTKS